MDHKPPLLFEASPDTAEALLESQGWTREEFATALAFRHAVQGAADDHGLKHHQQFSAYFTLLILTIARTPPTHRKALVTAIHAELMKLVPPEGPVQ